MKVDPSYRDPQYDRFKSSPEILRAIEEMAGNSLLLDPEEDDDLMAVQENDIDTEGEAYRIWADPTADEFRAVAARAWELADPECTHLYWGLGTTLTRG
ncbi:MAG: hypothetical protein N2483_03985 [Burkholderiaceae bacterium]|nr:hypothetical protein [Burkholderiaceae bacterium]